MSSAKLRRWYAIIGALLIAVGGLCGCGASDTAENGSPTGSATGAQPLAPATALASNTVTLAWDPVTHPNLVGYRVYFGTAPGTYSQATGNGVNVGSATTHTVTGLSSGTRYYFAVTAYDAANSESPFSNEVFLDAP
jgi:hypothetical protein